ncbi:hypothetical protein CYY_001133 [Polysphondylium violaceum]|uniref:alpha-1,2-Mannosidase n=1 Tax=Polysphondylium violaceum TaxID=133409 RepID=A0A8J4V4V1_9MYCE|nr:hypothetical protein CYY_001133 [Polysphondylium violaceum]
MLVAIFIIGSLTIFSFDTSQLNKNEQNIVPKKWRNVGSKGVVEKNLEENEKFDEIKITPSTYTRPPPPPPSQPQHVPKTSEVSRPTSQQKVEVNPLNRIDIVYKANERLNQERAYAVRGAMKYAWDSYSRYTWGLDELRPISRSTNEWFGLGLTIVDSLDTLYLLNLDEEYREAKKFVRNLDLSKETQFYPSVFETSIRFLGGFISTYHLTNDQLFLTKAEEMGKILLGAFEKDEVFPFQTYNFHTKKGHFASWTGGCVILSEVGTMFIEFEELSKLTNNPIWKTKADKILDTINNLKTEIPGLFPVYIDSKGESFCNNHISLGALGDSYYEYLLKMWLYSDKKHERYRTLFVKSANAIIDKMYKETKLGYGYIPNLINNHLTLTQEHLTCFTGGMFALAAATNISHDDAISKKYMKVAEKVTETCAKSYFATPSGLGPEVAAFDRETGEIIFNGSNQSVPGYFLRPEAVESIFILYRLTGDVKYQEWAWKIFEAIEKHCKTEGGYAGLKSVSIPDLKDDLQQSFFMAETLKYIYLLFVDSSVVPLDKYVFNTEAHPILINKNYKY